MVVFFVVVGAVNALVDRGNVNVGVVLLVLATPGVVPVVGTIGVLDVVAFVVEVLTPAINKAIGCNRLHCAATRRIMVNRLANYTRSCVLRAPWNGVCGFHSLISIV